MPLGGEGGDGIPADGEIVSTQTVSSKTRTVETITVSQFICIFKYETVIIKLNLNIFQYKTERDGLVETRVEQKITIQSDGDPIDHDKALAEAIQVKNYNILKLFYRN